MKKIGLLMLVMVIALGALGIGYASWTDQINITGPVGTGSVCVKWYGINPHYDQCPHGPDVNGSWTTGNLDANLDVFAVTGNANGWPMMGVKSTPSYIVDKNVACTTVSGVNTDTLTITVDNAYPLYYNDIEIEFVNCGTIPVKLVNYVITPVDFVLANQTWSNAEHPSNGGPVWVGLVTGGESGTQLEPGDALASSLKFVVQQSATQGRSYTFKITWNFIQWNEYEEPD
jgi:hypothetical protein